jgi:hypothetical protein
LWHLLFPEKPLPDIIERSNVEELCCCLSNVSLCALVGGLLATIATVLNCGIIFFHEWYLPLVFFGGRNCTAVRTFVAHQLNTHPKNLQNIARARECPFLAQKSRSVAPAKVRVPSTPKKSDNKKWPEFCLVRNTFL